MNCPIDGYNVNNRNVLVIQTKFYRYSKNKIKTASKKSFY